MTDLTEAHATAHDDADFDTIRYEAHDHVARITLARAEKRNAITADMFRELGDAAERAAADPDVRVVAVGGDGPSFCAGIDLGALAGLGGADPNDFTTFVSMAQRPFRVLATMEKPTIAAVRGHALGAGFQLALACDLRLATRDVSFGMLEVRYGIIPDLGGQHHLARLVGPARAKELVWTTRTLGADEAERIGLVNQVVDDLDAATDELIAGLLSRAPLPQSLTKGLIDHSFETPFETHLEREQLAQQACLASDDHREAVAAFFEKRPPRFTGR